MNWIEDPLVEEWARNWASSAGVEYVPTIRVREGEKHGHRVVQFLFDRAARFQACAVAMRFLDHDKGPVALSVHAENWLALDVELPEETTVAGPRGDTASTGGTTDE
ncbi:hypothetical protein ACMA1D_18125 [Streptomyces sp. 796.1]|uniref:hypothetical protein n=1 Tax=Streptomyces sp. 796.1 TaxID=3163029 RepID=UPI0039C94A27